MLDLKRERIFIFIGAYLSFLNDKVKQKKLKI